MWDTAEFKRINYVLTAIWAITFAIVVGADLLLVFAPHVPARVGVIITIAALVGAVKFTGWYPTRGEPKTAV